jgi:hypothetical protein
MDTEADTHIPKNAGEEPETEADVDSLIETDETIEKATPDTTASATMGMGEDTSEDSETSESTTESAENERLAKVEQAQNIGAQLLVLKGNTLNEELAGKTEDEKKKILEDPGKRKIKEVGDLLYGYDGSTPLNASTGEPILVQINGQQGNIQRITGIGENNSLICEVKLADGTNQTQELPRIQVALAQLVAERTLILGQFSDSEQVVLKTYLDIIQHTGHGELTLPDELPDAIDNIKESVELQAEELGKTNPKMRKALDLLAAGKVEDVIREASNGDPKEENRLRKLVESGDLKMGGLFLLMILISTFSAVGKLSN